MLKLFSVFLSALRVSVLFFTITKKNPTLHQILKLNFMQNLDQNDAYREYQEYLRKPLSVGEWFITILVIAIPLVGFVMLFVWAFSANTNVNRANYAKAALLWMVVGIFIALAVLGFLGVAFFGNLFNV